MHVERPDNIAVFNVKAFTLPHKTLNSALTFFTHLRFAHVIRTLYDPQNTAIFFNYFTNSSVERADSLPKCATEQAKFDEENKFRVVGLRPTCWDDGNYALEQCYSSGFCHCADPLTGQPTTKLFKGDKVDKPNCGVVHSLIL